MRLFYLPSYGGVLKPFIEAVILGQSPILTRALVDSGADCSLFDLALAQVAGIPVEMSTPRSLRGLGGSLQAYPGTMTVQVARRRISLHALFASNFSPNILGRNDFFHLFHVCFNEQKHEIDLRYRRR